MTHRVCVFFTAVTLTLGAAAAWGQGYLLPGDPAYGYSTGYGYPSYPYGSGCALRPLTPLPVDAFGYRSPSGGSRSYRHLYGRDGLASQRPRRHSARVFETNARGQTITTDYYYDSADERHYFDSAARSRVYEDYYTAGGGSVATSWPGVYDPQPRRYILGDAPYVYGGRPAWRGSWGRGYVRTTGDD